MRSNCTFLYILVCTSLFAGEVSSNKGSNRLKRKHRTQHSITHDVIHKDEGFLTQDNNSHNVTKKSTIENSIYYGIKNHGFEHPGREHQRKKSEISRTNETRNDKELQGKKSEISGIEKMPVERNVDVEKHKRGFLANLASLLNDAELISSRKNVENGLTAINANFPVSPEARQKSASTDNRIVKSQKESKVSAMELSDITKNKDARYEKINKSIDAIGGKLKNVVITKSPERSVNYVQKEEIHAPPPPPPPPLPPQLPPPQPPPPPPPSSSSTFLPKSEHTFPPLNDSGEDFAPIFTMYHGKIVQLGKLAHSSFEKKSMFIESPIDKSYLSTDIPTESDKAQNDVRESDQIPKYITGSPHISKDVTGSKRTLYSEDERNHHIVSKIQEKKDLTKLQQYLNNLDDHISPTTKEEHAKDVAKDEVVFPEGDTSISNDLLHHVKGIVLDNGKILSVKGNEEKTAVKEKINSHLENSPQKYYVNEDGTLAPVIKNKPDVPDTPALPETKSTSPADSPDSQRTPAFNLDVLKELLKKPDVKVSIASLLNKTPDMKNEAPSEPEEEDPGTKKSGSNISLASLLNKTPEEKSDTPKEVEDEDPGTIEDFAAGGLKAHNEYRARHHDEPLVWSDDIAAKAQKLAETLADKKTLEIAKDLEKEGFGENVAKVWATFKTAGEAAAKMWYSQNENYHFDDPHLDENTGQFAQVVWKSTKELGMGVAKSIDDVNNKYVYVTALYRPPGNVETVLRENVLPTGNNTVDVYTTFFKRGGVLLNDNGNAT